MIVSVICKTVIDYAVRIGWIHACIPISIIVSKCLTKYSVKHTLKKGYLNMKSYQGNHSVFHCWVELNNGIKIDLSSTINTMLIPESIYITERILSETEMDGYTRIDIDNEYNLKEIDNSIKMIDCYIEHGNLNECEKFYIHNNSNSKDMDDLKHYMNDISNIVDNIVSNSGII